MPARRFLRSFAVLSVLVTQVVPAAAQPGPLPPPAADAAALGQATTAPLTAEQLDRLLDPFAGAPQDVLAVVLDACRYPAELLEAVQWSAQPEATRGAPEAGWPPTVRILAERAPRTLQFLTQDIASTAALGAAFQTQPNDVWLAYGRVTMARAGAEPARAPGNATGPGTVAADAAGQAPAAAPGGSQETQPAGAGPAKTSGAAVVPLQPAPVEGAPVVVTTPPAQVVTTPAPATGMSPGGAALAGGVLGLGAGLLISELAHDHDDYWGAPGYGYGYRPPYAVPPPYAPYAGARYDASRALQEDRQAAVRQGQQERQASITERREGSQAAAGERAQQRQAASGERQASRQDSAAARQTGRQGATQERQQGRREDLSDRPQAEQRSAMADAGQERRAAATAGQARPQPAAAQQRAASLQRPPAAAAQPRPAARAPDWGPARGMSGGAELSRSRAPSPGAAAGRSGGEGARAGGARAGGGHGGRR